MRAWFSLMLLFITSNLSAQVTAAFSIDPTTCLDQKIALTNTSVGAITYGWDFCHRDLDAFPLAAATISATSTSILTSIQFVYEQGNWFGFITGQNNSNLSRLDFGSSLENTPALVNLGTLGGSLSGPKNIRFVKEAGTWYGVIINSTNNTLARLSFLSGISNPPTVQSLGNLDSWTQVYGLDLVYDGTQWIAVVADLSGNKLSLVNFGASVQNNPGPGQVTTISDASLVGPLGVRIVQDQGNWYGIVALFGSHKVVRLSFGPALSSSPSIDDLYAATSPTEVTLFKEGDTWQCHFSTLAGNVHHLRIGSTMSGPVGSMVKENLGSFGGFNNAIAFTMVRSQPIWYGFLADFSSSTIYRLRFQGSCSENSIDSATEASPTITYATPGTYRVELNAMDANGNVSTVQASTFVQNIQAPQPNFTTTLNCVAGGTQFMGNESSGQPVASWGWSFGDAGVATGQNAVHSYATAGSFVATLEAHALTGCKNYFQKQVDIFNPPVADFSLPTATPVCTNQSFTFSNSSIVDPGATASWEWTIDGMATSTDKDLTESFASSSSYLISLNVMVEGCQNAISKNFNVTVDGPLVDFSFDGICFSGITSFSNMTAGSVAAYQWSLGDGTIVTSEDVAHTYSTPGTYSVVLQASNLEGCMNLATKDITIYTLPQPDFSVAAVPFSCTASPTIFQNQTPPPADSNITNWLWSFGDASLSTSTAQQPTFVYNVAGKYTVSLTATTDVGCANIFTKTEVEIKQSPTANFVQGAACVNAPTQFSDTSSGTVQSRVWQLGTATFSSPNPTYTYANPGTYTAMLTVTGTNGCSNMVSKPVNVPVPPIFTLQAENTCANQPAVFTLVDAILPPSNDPVNSWQWNIGGTLISGNPATAVLPQASSTPVSVITTHASGCSYTQLHTTTIHPTPVANFMADPDRGDAPLTVQFENLSSGATQYRWMFYDKIPVSSTAISPVYTFLELGDYSVRLTATNAFGCSDSTSMPIQVIIPKIDLEVTSFSLFPDPATGKLRPSITLLNKSNILVGSVEVVLLLSDRASVSEALLVNLSPGASVTKTLAAVVDPSQFPDPFLCVQVISEKDLTPGNNKSCINFSNEDYIFEPYPNPSSDLVWADWISEQVGTASVTVVNSQGRLEYYWETPSQAGLNRSAHDLSFLAAGIYFVTVRTSSSIKTSRIVRQ